MLKKFLTPKRILILILLFAAFTRLYRLDFPDAYVFDEVYHAFTAKEYIKGSPAAWEWWTVPPPGVAYEWTHPPIAKEIMAVSMEVLHNENAWAYRLPGALLGILSVYLVYLISQELFRKEPISLLSAFLFSIDGLNFVQSRTGMNDIYIVTFALVSLFLILRKKYFWSSIFLGLSFASKWSGVYLLGLEIIILITQKPPLRHILHKLFGFRDLLTKKQDYRDYIHIAYFVTIPLVVYMISYIPFFQLGHTLPQFRELQQQMWWYHTNLVAHHDYSSPWWSWPLNLYPVWYYVKYYPNGFVSNIFTVGNSVLFWLGSAAVLTALIEFARKKTQDLWIPLLGFFIFWLPWAKSPRIMFLYHFSPSVPFMSMLLSYETYQVSQKRGVWVIILVATLALIGFLAFYPWMTGVPLPRNIMQLFFLFNLAKNPFK